MSTAAATLNALIGNGWELDRSGPEGLVGVSLEGDIIGAGETEDDAIEDAICTVASWEGAPDA